MDQFKNTCQRGEALEHYFSKSLHPNSIPLLIEPALLRSVGVGQIDLARVMRKNGNWFIEVFEVKQFGEVTHQQLKRLRDAAEMISAILNLSVKFKILSLPKEQSFINLKR